MTHVLVRLRGCAQQLNLSHQPVIPVIHSFLPELKAFCIEQQSITDTRTQSLRALVNNNKLLLEFPSSKSIVESTQKLLFILDSQSNNIRLALQIARSQDESYSAYAQRATPTAQLRVIIQKLQDTEKKLQTLFKTVQPFIRSTVERHASFDEQFERESKQSREDLFVRNFEAEDARAEKTIESLVHNTAAEIKITLKDVVFLNQEFAALFTKALAAIATIERELATGAPEAKPLTQNVFTLNELLAN